MAKQAASAAKSKPGLITQVREFLREVKVEMSKVTWPSKEELKSSTQVVLMMLVVVAAIIYVYDVVFQYVVMRLLQFG